MSAASLASPVRESRIGLTLAGVGFALVTVVIWALWLVSTRQAAAVALPVGWLGIFRFAPPAILLAPFWWRRGLIPRGVDRRLLAAMVAGAGTPYFLAVATGMEHASAAEGGVLLGGTMPFFVAIGAALVFRERLSRLQFAGFALVLVAMALIGGLAVLEGAAAGRLLILAGAALWALYPLAFARSGLSPMTAAGIVAAWSTILFVPLALAEGWAPIAAAGLPMVGEQVMAQGVLSGVVALVCYGAAITRLGATRAAVFTALPPALAALMAIPVLGEIPTPLTLAGIGLAVAGVALASASGKGGH
jgi:drug/metabolite transporter (DMT)-like permease